MVSSLTRGDYGDSYYVVLSGSMECLIPYVRTGKSGFTKTSLYTFLTNNQDYFDFKKNPGVRFMKEYVKKFKKP